MQILQGRIIRILGNVSSIARFDLNTGNHCGLYVWFSVYRFADTGSIVFEFEGDRYLVCGGAAQEFISVYVCKFCHLQQTVSQRARPSITSYKTDQHIYRC